MKLGGVYFLADVRNMVSKFWQKESYGVSERQKPNILPQTEQRALNFF